MTDKANIALWLTQLAASIVTDAQDAAELGERTAALPGLEHAAFAAASIDIARIIAESARTPEAFDAIIPPADITADDMGAIAVLQSIILSISGGRAAFRSRPQARRARSRIDAAGTTALAQISTEGADGVALYEWLGRLTGIAVRLVSDRAATTAPIVRIKTGVSLPATVLAYQLYGDANRAGDLVDIAGSATPMLMPVEFDALAP